MVPLIVLVVGRSSPCWNYESYMVNSTRPAPEECNGSDWISAVEVRAESLTTASGAVYKGVVEAIHERQFRQCKTLVSTSSRTNKMIFVFLRRTLIALLLVSSLRGRSLKCCLI
jgi:hypothetical protein